MSDNYIYYNNCNNEDEQLESRVSGILMHDGIMHRLIWNYFFSMYIFTVVSNGNCQAACAQSKK